MQQTIQVWSILGTHASQCWVHLLERRLSNARWPPAASAPPARGAPPCWLPGQAKVHLHLLCTRLPKMREPGSMSSLLLVKTPFKLVPCLQTYLTACLDQKCSFHPFQVPFPWTCTHQLPRPAEVGNSAPFSFRVWSFSGKQILASHTTTAW